MVISPRVFRCCLLALLVAAAAFFARAILFDKKVAFLTPGPGEWIVYPARRNTQVLDATALSSWFARRFTLESAPPAANLSWRCFRAGALRVNGTVVSQVAPSADWKKIDRLDIAQYLRRGTNIIEARIGSDFGPPALSLRLQAGNFALESDERWQVSQDGAPWREARAAWKTPPAQPGNEIYGSETMAEAWRRRWPLVAIFAGVAAVGAGFLLWAGRRWGIKIQASVFVISGAAWIALFAHNCNLAPLAAGFDAPDHLDYVRYLLVHKAMPSPNQGFEMFQPPLYHACAALLLGLLHLTTKEMAGMVALRWFNVAMGLTELAFIFASLRLLFPGEWRKQAAGLLMGAFLPMLLYLLNYPTNETFSAMWVTIALYLTLRILRAPDISPGRCAALGAALGAAMLAKASALVALALILGAVAAKLVCKRERSAAVWMTTVGLSAEICLAICGWHYWNMWRHFGNPLAGNWDTTIAIPWWQYPGYHTWRDYLSFGKVFTAPFFSAFDSVWDSLYSTLWGDGMCGGPGALFQRPPWNYNLMALGFVLALVPSALVLTGFIRAAAECWKRPRLEWILILAMAVCYGLAIIYMTLKLPLYSQSKSFYGLPALLSFCVFAALGWEFLAGAGRFRSWILLTLLGTWLAVVYASLWIRPGTVETEIAQGAAEFSFGSPQQAAADFRKVVKTDPWNSVANAYLAELDSRENRNDLAAERVERVLKKYPQDAYLAARGAPYLAVTGHGAEALQWASNATVQAPDDPAAPEIWCALALEQKDYATAARAGRIALARDPSKPSTHLDLGLALLHLGQTNEAAAQLMMAASGYPPSQEARDVLERLGKAGGR